MSVIAAGGGIIATAIVAVVVIQLMVNAELARSKKDYREHDR